MSGFISALLRGLVLLWTLLITALIGNVIASNVNASSSASMAVNYAMFTAAWAWIAGLVGLAAVFVASLARPLVMLPLDGLAVIFSLVAAIVLAAKVRAVDCGNVRNDNLPSNWIGFGSRDDQKRCRELQASTAFMWFLWASLCGCLVFSFLSWRSGGLGRPRRSRGPNMTQV